MKEDDCSIKNGDKIEIVSQRGVTTVAINGITINCVTSLCFEQKGNEKANLTMELNFD